MVAEPVVRVAAPSDVPVLAAFRAAMFAELDAEYAALLDAMQAAFAEYAARAIPSGEFVGWVAEADGAVVAVAALVFEQLPPQPHNLEGRVGHILNVFVVPAWRRRGLATRLVQVAIQHCRSLGLKSVVLHASDAGRLVYERLGFTPTSEMRLSLG